jgi:hypothetical protein
VQRAEAVISHPEWRVGWTVVDTCRQNLPVELRKGKKEGKLRFLGCADYLPQTKYAQHLNMLLVVFAHTDLQIPVLSYAYGL